MKTEERSRLQTLTSYPLRKETARGLRRTQTEAEHKLWSHLRNRQLGGFKFRRQFPVGPFFTDFCCMEKRLIIEVDGRQHLGMTDVDENRTRALEDFGFFVIRFWNDEVMEKTDLVCDRILRLLLGGNPLPSGEGTRRAG